MDMQKEREAFEQSPKVAKRLSGLHPTIVWFGEDNLYHSSFEGFQDMVHWLNGGWEAWQAAKAESHKSASLYQWEINHLAAANQQWRDYAAKASAVPQWISTSDRMPEEGEEVLVHNLGQVRQVTRDSAWVGGFKERNCYGWQAAYSQSHWMPKSIELPERYHFYYENDAKQKAMIEAAQD